MFIGFVVFLMWGLALIFLLLTLFFIKLKFGRWIFGTLTVLFGIAPFVMFWGIENGRLDQQETFIGRYSNEETGNFIELDKNLTWKSDSALFECTSGSWKYIITEDMSYLELEGRCHDGYTSVQIYSATPDELTFSPDQNSSMLKPTVELKRD